MRIILTISILLSVVLMEAQGHKHIPKNTPATYGLYRDSTTIKYNVITYGILEYQCKVCGAVIRERHNADTFSIRRQAKYSNLKYKSTPKKRAISYDDVDAPVGTFKKPKH